MERTITQSGALYFVQHKRTVPTLRQHRAAPRIWNFRIRSARRLRLPGTVFKEAHNLGQEAARLNCHKLIKGLEKAKAQGR